MNKEQRKDYQEQSFRNSVQEWFLANPEDKTAIIRDYHYWQENRIILIGKIPTNSGHLF